MLNALPEPRWRSAVFAPRGDGTTRRRGSDAVRVVLAALIVIVCWVLSLAGRPFESAVMGFLTPPPSGIKWLVTLVWIMGSIGLIIAVAGVALVAGRRAMARDVLAAGLGAWVLSWLIQVAVGPHLGGDSGVLAHVDVRYPQTQMAVTVVVALAALPYVSRGIKRAFVIILVLAATATVLHGSGLVLSVTAGVAIGWGTAAAVALVFGSPLGLPSAGDVAALLSSLGPLADVRPSTHQEWGVARFLASETGGTLGQPRGGRSGLAVSVYGRDARDAQLFSKVYRYALYRDSGPTLTFTRLQQVEHEAYLTLRAVSAGTRAPQVVHACRAGPSGDALLVVRLPSGRPLRDAFTEPKEVSAGPGAARASAKATTKVSSATPAHAMSDSQTPTVARRLSLSDRGADAVLDQVLTLRRARLAHGSIGLDTVVIHGDEAGLVEFRLATSDARQEQLDRDVACALATLALVAGPERTVAAASRTLPDDALAVALPFLQRAALSSSLAKDYRGRKATLARLRELGAKAAGVEVPKLAEPRRMSWVTLALLIGTLIGGWALIGVFVNVGKSFDTIKAADVGWVIAVAMLAIGTYPALAFETLGAVLEALPFGRVVSLEVADTFVGLAGGTMAVLATRVRFFQQQGYQATVAVSSGVLISMVSWIVKGALFLIALPFALGTLHLAKKTSGSADTVRLVILAIIIIGVALGLIFAIPRVRRTIKDKLWPRLSEVVDQFRKLSRTPKKLVQIFGGAIIAQFLVVFALGASLQAFGQHESIATLVVVITLASVLGGVSPVPGGVGVVEAGMILGLTSAGIPESEAVAAVFIQRLFTSYLPPLFGWFALMLMRRREYL